MSFFEFWNYHIFHDLNDILFYFSKLQFFPPQKKKNIFIIFHDLYTNIYTLLWYCRMSSEII
jgi:hypothetical protein